MPKTEKLCTKRSAVIARERREKEKKEHRYNAVLKEFLHFKYNHVITEFDSFYEKMKTDRPSNMCYTNTNEYRLWQKQYMEKAFPWGKEEQQQQAEQQQDERQQQVEPPQQNELAHLVNDIVNEVEDIIPDHNEQQQQAEQQQDDEGIALDVWEELQGDIQEFDYNLEVELDRYLQ